MSPFEELSNEIDQISKLHSKSRLVRVLRRIEYWRRRYWTNETIPFEWVGEGGAPVGEPIEVVHMTLYDMMEHQVGGILTRKILLEGLRVNAVQKLGFERLDQWHGKTTVQPRWV